MRVILTILILLLHLNLAAQVFTVSGTVKNSGNGEDLIGVIVQAKGFPTYGTSTNEYGYYALVLPEGEHFLTFSYVGYRTLEKKVMVAQNISMNVDLQLNSGGLNEVTIKAVKQNSNITSVGIGIEKLDIKKIETIPVLFGEKDIMKVMQMTPGVKAAGEGNSGFYVRGGAADQNLVLVDEAPVYNASHLLGFFSIFNSDALKEATLYKGGIPAQFGGRLSSVLDIKLKEGNNQRFSASGGIGTISSRLTVEAPLASNKGAFIVSGRRTYADLFLKLSNNEELRKSTLYFYDLNFKANYQINDNNRVFASGYLGRDVFNFKKVFSNNWGNTTATLRWNHLFNPKVFSNTSLIFSNYNYDLSFGKANEETRVKAGIQDLNLKQDFTFAASKNNAIKAGANIIHHLFLPGEIEADGGSNFNSQKVASKRALEGGVYIQDEITPSEKFSVQLGVRYSFFSSIQKGEVFSYNEDGTGRLIAKHNDWESTHFYGGLEPRASMRLMLDKLSSLKAGYNRLYQYMHLLNNSSTSSPLDQWVSSSNNIKPQIADQFSIGYFRNTADNRFEISLETYYKNLKNQIDYRPAADLLFNEQVEGELIYGSGLAYGLEVSIRKQTGKLNGWISYSLSRSIRSFAGIDDGKSFPAKQDRIHDLAIVALYDLTSKLKVSANWIYYTGSAATFPSGKYSIGGVQVPYYTERNGYRMPDYHRLDIGITWYRRKTERTESSWNFSLYNAYGRENSYTISFRQKDDVPQQTEAVQTTLFRWVPSITYNFKF